MNPLFTCTALGVCLAVLPEASVFGQWQGPGAMTVRATEENQITFASRNSTVVIKVLTPDLVRVRAGRGGNPGNDYSWSVIKTDWPAVRVDSGGDQQTKIIRTAALELRVQLSPFRVSFYDPSGRLISQDVREMSWDGKRVRCWKSMPSDEHYFGLGEKTGPLDKRGHSYVMWNTDPSGYDALTDPMYQTIPFFMGIRQGKAYGLFFDNTYRSSFDMGTESPDFYSFGADGGEMNYYFFSGPDPKQILSRYTELVGRTELPPMWSLGYMQSSAFYFPESTVRFVADNLRHRRFPCDAIFLDTMHMDDNRDFTWDKSRFPDPPRMIADLGKQGFRVFSIVDPGLKVEDSYWAYKQGAAGNYFLKRKDGTTFVGYMWPGKSVFPDFTSEKVRAWWASLFEGLIKDGMAGFLTDMNEPTAGAVPVEQAWLPKALDPDVIHYDHALYTSDAKNHNVYGLLMSAATRDALLHFHPNERPFVITRATYAGGQRYAAQWTGDNMATWEDLCASLRIVMSMGLSGLPFTGSDTGGFVGVPSPELYTRWLEAGVFHPFFWTHTGSRDRGLDPWSFGSEMEQVNRRIIELRYALLPYLYNAMYEAAQTGLPVMRALVLDYPDDTNVMDLTPDNRTSEFLFGNDLLVAPVVKTGDTERVVYFPKGTWYDFKTGKRYTGPLKTTVDAPLAHIPIFARGGAIIPMRQVVEYVDQAPIDPLTFEIYPEGESVRDYYEDDGISLAYKHGKYLLQKMAVRESDSEINLKLSPREGSYTPPARSLVFKIHGFTRAPQTIALGGRSAEISSDASALTGRDRGAVYELDTRTVWIKTPDQGAGLEVRIQK
jgi:alpha-glucosidase